MELPLAGNGRGVTGFIHHVAKSDLVLVERAKLDIVPDAIAPGHDLDPTGGAHRLGVTMVKLCPGACQGIQAWRGEEFAAIAPVIIRRRIISHNQDNVEWFLGIRGWHQGKHANKNGEENTTHYFHSNFKG